jgi:hypothetical protein
VNEITVNAIELFELSVFGYVRAGGTRWLVFGDGEFGPHVVEAAWVEFEIREDMIDDQEKSYQLWWDIANFADEATRDRCIAALERKNAA